MMKAAVLGALMLCLGVPARAAEVVVRVLNVADASGSVRVEVCGAAEWLKGCALSAHAAAVAGVSEVVVRGVPPGAYGIIAHHDSDDDGEVARNFLGIPTEGIGFSRDAPFRLGPPRFADAVVEVAGERVVVEVTLHFERAR